ncbi:hypothetical protein BDN72DRAFT_161811 [Pluteus cervinus]|uniref:Uncharacterized protein n=1 Tax=Pluteus cervinus TaxID=181527 RepID=A0ACD3AK41_9AGAR|nr:hypothetical protein BDN72DRAFT_161811 [Pluteus cervinus]
MIRIIDMPDVVAINETISIPTLRALHGTANANLLKVVINGTDILQHVHLGVITPQSARECLQALLGKRQALKSLSLTIRVSEGAMYLGIERLVLFPNLKALELGFTSPMHESDFVDNVYDLLSNPVITFPSTLEHFAIKFTSMQGIAWSESLQPLVIDNSWAANFPKLHYLELSEKEGYAVRYDHVRGKMTEEIQLWDDLVKSQLGF